MVEKKKKLTGLQIAIGVTIEISKRLSKFKDTELRTKLIQSIFDDQLQIYTKMNRQQRHSARKLLKEALAHYDTN